MNRGKFIVFEGGDGSGKSTTLEKIYDFLVAEGIDCIKTREPGGIKISEDIRNIILDTKNTEMDRKTEALLYAAARRQHLVEKVIPALEKGKIVLCDRFIYSSLAYQGYARGIPVEEIFQINKFAIGEYMPDLNLFFDISPEVGISRIEKNKDREVNRLDLEKLDFHTRVREGYYKLVENNRGDFAIINAEKSIDEVFNETKEIILNFIK